MAEQGVDRRRRRFLTAATSVVGAVGCGFAVVPFVSSMQPSARARAAGAPVEVDISALAPGQQLTVEWRGKPVWIVRRTPENIQQLPDRVDKLADPDSENPDQQPTYAANAVRAIKGEYLVVVGICTHLGCSPTYMVDVAPPGDNDWQGGFFCPCHGSKFDLAGRVYAGMPAPTNLLVPPHAYLADTRLVIGLNPEEVQA